MSKPLFVFLLSFCSLFAWGQHLVSATSLGTTPAYLLSTFTAEAVHDVEYYKIVYNTTDIDGSATIASGGLAVPVNSGCTSFPVAVYNHGTVLEDEDVPSRNNFEASVPKVCASTGAIAVAPDYLGLGDNPGLHPYLHAESEATATLDLIRAAREFVTSDLSISHNNEVFVTGYSQGGHAAMATAKYAQDHNLLNEFNIIGAAPASGPYNLSGTQAEALVSNQPYSNPGYVPYLFFAMNRVYGNVFQDYSDLLKAPYDSILPPYFDGTHDMMTVNALLPDTIRGFIEDSVLNNFISDSINKTHPIWQFLTANDNYDWNPSFPVEMYYCLLDEQVAYQNALDAEAAMQARGADAKAVLKGAHNHSGCFRPSLLGALDFFLDVRTECTPIGIDELAEQAGRIEMYPNPAANRFYFANFEGTATVEAYTATGKLMLKTEITNERPIDIHNWPSGIYSIRLIGEGMEISQKLVVRH